MAQPLTDAMLVAQARRGETSAYEVLVCRWSARVTAYLRARVVHVDVAEDLAQESLLRAYRSLATLAQPEKFGPWLLSIAHRAALDWLKAKARTEVRFADLENRTEETVSPDWSDGGPSPDTLSENNEQNRLLRACVDSLPTTLREVLLIYYYDQVTYKEIAEMLGVSTATVNARLTKARALLREKISATRSD